MKIMQKMYNVFGINMFNSNTSKEFYSIWGFNFSNGEACTSRVSVNQNRFYRKPKVNTFVNHTEKTTK